jgi:hypothetical protein
MVGHGVAEKSVDLRRHGFITDVSAVDKVTSRVRSAMLLLNNIPLVPLAQDYVAENTPHLKIK